MIKRLHVSKSALVAIYDSAIYRNLVTNAETCEYTAHGTGYLRTDIYRNGIYIYIGEGRTNGRSEFTVFADYSYNGRFIRLYEPARADKTVGAALVRMALSIMKESKANTARGYLSRRLRAWAFNTQD